MKLCLYKVGEGEWINHISKVRESEHLEESLFFIALSLNHQNS